MNPSPARRNDHDHDKDHNDSSMTSDLTSGGVKHNGPPGFEFLAPPQQPDEIGRLGPYRILGQLGAGGMGMVFRAEDPTLRRAIALKVMLPTVAVNPVAKARFIREARSQAKIEHDNVIPIYLVSEDRGVPFLAMPLLKGQPLSAALKQNPRPPVAEVLRIGREMAEGLAAAHELHLVHRDIKPANVWLEGHKRRVKILDFGLARVESEAELTADNEPVTREGAVVGTPAYMSPEQARGDAVDGRTDLFSLGIVMYQMATGELPFKGATAMAILMSLGIDTPIHPSLKNPAIPQPLGDLIMRLLAKPVAERPASAEAVASEIEQIERGSHVAVAPPMQTFINVANDPWADIDATDSSMTVPPPARNTRRPDRTSTVAEADDSPTRSKMPLLIGGGVAALLVLGLGGYFAFRSPKPKLVAAVPTAVIERPTTTTSSAPRVNRDTAARAFAKFVLDSGEGAILRIDSPSEVYQTSLKDLPASFRFHDVKLGANTSPDCAEAVAAMAPLAPDQWDDNFAHFAVSPTCNDAGVEKLVRPPFLRGIKSLAFSGSQITDAAMKSLPGLTNLKGVDFRLTWVDGSGFVHLAKVPLLEYVGLTKCPIKPEHLAAFSSTSLKSLALDLCETIDDSAIEPLSRIKTLTYLNLHQTKVTAEGVQSLSAALPLCRIDSDHGVIMPKSSLPATPSSTGPSAADLALLNFVLRTGGELRVVDENQKVQSVTKPEDFPATFKYRTISLSNNFAPDATDAAQILGAIAADRWDAIAELTIRHENFNDHGLDRLSKVPFVSATGRLSLTKSLVSDEGLVSLRAFTKLNYLDVGESKNITGAGFAHLKSLPALSGLRAARCPLTSASLKDLTDIPLHTLKVDSDLSLGDEVIESLSKMTTLRHIDITGTGLTAEGVNRLKAALPCCALNTPHGRFEGKPPLEFAKPMFDRIVKAGGRFKVVVNEKQGDWWDGISPLHKDGQIGEILFGNETTYKDKARQGEEVAEWFAGVPASALSPKSSLQLGHCSPEGWRAIASTPALRFLNTAVLANTPRDDALPELARFPHLKTLRLLGGQSTDAGMKTIATFPTLRNLDLSISRVTAAGLAEITALPLEMLTMADCSAITDDAVAPLSRMGSLKHLRINKTGMTAEGVKKLAEALPRCEILSDFGKFERRMVVPQAAGVVDPTFFNGTDLAGWQGSPQWKVVKGQLVLEPDGIATPRLLSSTKSYRDFELAFDLWLDPKVKSNDGYAGVFLRAAVPLKGMDGFRIAKLSPAGSMYLTGSGNVSATPGPDGSTPINARLVGKRLTLTVGGKVVLDKDVDVPSEGYITWLGSGERQSRYRNIRFTDLSQPVAVQASPVDSSFFNGRDLTGWKAARSGGADPSGVWKVENGELVGTKPEGGYAYLNFDKPIQDFELSFEARTLGHNPDGKGYSSLRFRRSGFGANADSLGVELATLPARLIRIVSGNKLSVLASKSNTELGSPNTKEFHKFFVRAQGDRFLVKIDDRVTVDQEIPDLSKGEIFGWQLDPSTAELRLRNIQFKDLSAKPVGGAWMPLFNGTDLAGWEKQGGDWNAQEGAITSSVRGYLRSARGNYGDFHLRAEVKCADAANGGIYFRTENPVNETKDYEAQISGPKNPDTRKTGSLYRLADFKENIVKPDEWFAYEIITKGNRIRLLVNGKETANYEDSRPERREKGHIALQAMTPGVFFRKIEIREGSGEPGAVTPVAKPFVTIRNEMPSAAHDTLDAALTASQNGDVIEVRGPGPYRFGQAQTLFLKDKDVTVRAAAGVRPTLVTSPESEAITTVGIICVQDSLLRIQGFDVVANAPASVFTTRPRGNFEFVGCRFSCGEKAILLRVGTGKASLRNCVILNENGIAPVGADGTGAQLTCEGTAFITPQTSQSPIVVAPGDSQIRVARCTSTGPLLSVFPKPGEPLRVTVSDCLLPIGAIRYQRDANSTQLKWEGNRNVYAEGGLANGVAKQAEGKISVEEWLKTEPTSRAVKGLPVKSTKDFLRADGSPDYPAVAAYLSELRKLAPDVGADPALLASSSAKLPFAHLRNGVDIESYATLTEAFAAAQNNDIIEIRSPGPFAITSKIAVDSHLTLRAAPGIRPLFTRDANVKEQWLDVVKGSLRLEGLDVIDAGGPYLLWSHQQPVTLGITRCRILKIGSGVFIGFRGKLTITDSVLASKSKGTMIGLSDSTTPNGPGDLEVVNSALLSGLESAVAGYPSGQSVSLNRVTMGGKFFYGHPMPAGTPSRATQIRATNTLFMGPLGQVAELPYLTEWAGSANNVYPPGGLILFRGGTLTREAWENAGGKPGPNARTRNEQTPLVSWPESDAPEALFRSIGTYLSDLHQAYPEAGFVPLQ